MHLEGWLPIEWAIAAEESHCLFMHIGRWAFGGTPNVSLSPPNQLAHGGSEILASRRRKVLFAYGSLLIPTPLDQAASFQPLEAFSQDIGGDAFRGCEKISKTALAVEQYVAQDQQGPPIADEIQRTSNRAPGP